MCFIRVCYLLDHLHIATGIGNSPYLLVNVGTFGCREEPVCYEIARPDVVPSVRAHDSSSAHSYQKLERLFKSLRISYGLPPPPATQFCKQG